MDIVAADLVKEDPADVVVPGRRAEALDIRRIDIVAGDLVKEDPAAVEPVRREALDFRRIEENTPPAPARVVLVAAAAAAAAMLPPDPELFLSLEPPEIFLSRCMVLRPPPEFFLSRVRVELEPGRIFLPNRSPLLTFLMDFRPDACPGA